MIDHLSFSSIKTFLECPKKWYFKYIEKIPIPSNVYMELGKVLHSVFAKYLTDKKQKIHDILSEEISNEHTAFVFENSLKILSNQNVINFLEEIQPSAVEKQFEFSVYNTKIVGFIDCIDQFGTVIDFKITNKFDKESYWLQPLFYLKGCYENKIEINNKFSFVVIPRSSTEKLQVWSVSLSSGEFSRYFDFVLRAVLKDLEFYTKENNFPFTSHFSMCEMCPFNEICPNGKTVLETAEFFGKSVVNTLTEQG